MKQQRRHKRPSQVTQAPIAPVSLRLVAANNHEIERIVERLHQAFGDHVKVTNPRRIDGSLAWIVYGTFV